MISKLAGALVGLVCLAVSAAAIGVAMVVLTVAFGVYQALAGSPA